MKGKILGMSSNPDSMWYRFSPSDETLQNLDEIFDIYDNLFTEDKNKIHSYEFHTSDETFFKKITPNFIAYFIFTKNRAHLILRKTREWEKYDDKIHELFEFIPAKN